MKINEHYEKLRPENEAFIKNTQAYIRSELDNLAIDATDGAMDEDRRQRLLSEAKELEKASCMYLAAHESCEQLSDEINTQIKEYTKWHKKLQKHHFFKPSPTNGEIDYQEKKTHHFAAGLSFYKCFWIFFIGCFLGVVIETIFCIITRGHYESRTGLILGPFNLVYGLGAFALTYFLYKFRNRRASHAFVGGFIVGSIIEYLCSWFQETLFGSVSWDYSRYAFNLDGRICLLFSIFWGILGVVWIKTIYPRMSLWILMIPNRIGKALTWILLVFMLFNSLFSAVVVYRWSNRINGIQPSNELETWIDESYDNKRMENIFPNMTFTN